MRSVFASLPEARAFLQGYLAASQSQPVVYGPREVGPCQWEVVIDLPDSALTVRPSERIGRAG